MFKKKIFLPIIILVLVLSLAACTADNDDTGLDTPPVDDQEEILDGEDDGLVDDVEDTDITANNYEDLVVVPEEAFDIFIDKYPSVKVNKIKLDRDMGIYYYKIEGFLDTSEYEVKIDPIDGSIIKEEIENDDDMDEVEISRDHIAKIKALVDKALHETAEDAVLDEWTVEMNNGIVELEVEIKREGLDEIERTYNLDTGELIDLDD